jgi:hypothetical protein
VECSFSLESHFPDPDAVSQADAPIAMSFAARSTSGRAKAVRSIDQERGGARDWNARWAAPRWVKPASVRHRHDGADGAAVGRLLVIIPVRRLLLVGGQTRRILDYEVRSAKEVGLRCRGLESGSSLRRMEMAERQHNLDGEREQRQPGAKFDVFSNPLHEFAPTLGTAYPDCPDVTL